MKLKFNKKTVAFIAVVLSVILVGVGSTVAYLTAKTGETKNEFVPSFITCAVEENFTGGVKENVVIRNTGNANAFIRAAVIINFVSETDGKISSVTPKETQDYSIEWGNAWVKASNGFWYYAYPVAPNDTTPVLINSAKAINSPEGYRLQIQIVASAIQSEPVNVVNEVWGINAPNGALVVD